MSVKELYVVIQINLNFMVYSTPNNSYHEEFNTFVFLLLGSVLLRRAHNLFHFSITGLF